MSAPASLAPSAGGGDDAKAAPAGVRVRMELAGGLELLFGRVKAFSIVLPGAATVRALIAHARTELLQERVELFATGESVRPGILVLVNDVDWELEGMLDCVLRDGDVVVFISTLHGG